jgi:hypothetical protein
LDGLNWLTAQLALVSLILLNFAFE